MNTAATTSNTNTSGLGRSGFSSETARAPGSENANAASAAGHGDDQLIAAGPTRGHGAGGRPTTATP
jgi:hypothetical protein